MKRTVTNQELDNMKKAQEMLKSENIMKITYTKNTKIATVMCRKCTDIHAVESDTKALLKQFNDALEEVPISRIISLTPEEFQDFKENLLEDRKWLKGQDGIILVKEFGTDNQSGIIVQTSGFEYARYAGLPIKEMDYKKCPKCGKLYTDHPAISRTDNKTEICPRCGTIEALAEAGFDLKFIEMLDNLHNVANEFDVEIQLKGKGKKMTIKPEKEG